MPLPLIFLGAAALGLVKRKEAKENFERAKHIGTRAEKAYQKSEKNLQYMRDETNSILEELGNLKIAIFNNQIKHLIEVIKKTKKSKSKLSGFNESISPIELKEIETLILSTNVLSTNTNLAWVGAGALNALGMMSGIVLAPALAVGGFMMASKAEKALTEAIEYNADVDIAIAEMKRNEIILQALQANAIEMGSTLISSHPETT